MDDLELDETPPEESINPSRGGKSAAAYENERIAKMRSLLLDSDQAGDFATSLPIMERVATSVAKCYHISVNRLRSKNDNREALAARRTAIWIMHEKYRIFPTLIAQFFGIRDSRRVSISVDKLSLEIGYDEDLANQVTWCENNI